jgi:hypothetical protein
VIIIKHHIHTVNMSLAIIFYHQNFKKKKRTKIASNNQNFHTTKQFETNLLSRKLAREVERNNSSGPAQDITINFTIRPLSSHGNRNSSEKLARTEQMNRFFERTNQMKSKSEYKRKKDETFLSNCKSYKIFH